MKKYTDYQIKSSEECFLTEQEMKKVEWTKYVIVVPSEEDRKELMEAFEHFHDCRNIDTNNVVVCQLSHEYLDSTREPGIRNNIIVDKKYYDILTEGF